MAYGILIKMAADVARIQTDMASAKKFVSSGVKQINKVLGTIGVSLSVGLVASYFKNITLGAIKAADDLEELAEKVGVSADFLASMQLAAQVSGTSLEGLATSVRFLGKNISEAIIDPTGDMAQLFRDLDVSLIDVTGRVRQSEDVWLDMADVMSQLEKTPHKVAAALKAMGKGATEVQVLMNLGREGIEEFRREAVALGLVLDADTRQKLANLNDAFDKLSQLSRALGNAIAREVLPTFSGIAKSMLEAAKQTSAFQTAAQAVHVVLKLIASGASIASTAMKGFAIILAAQLAALRAFGSGEITQGLDILRMAFDDLRQNAQENATFLTQLWKETLPQLADATDKATKNNNEFTRSSDANVKAVTSLLSSLKEQIAIINESLILGRDLNAAEQLRTKILGDLEDGTLKLTLAEAKRIDLLLRLLDLRIKEKAEFDIEQKALDDIVQQNVALYDLIKAQEFENRTIGMTRREVEALALTRHDANIAMLQGAIDENFASEETIALLRIQLDLLKKLRDLERKGFQQRNDSSALAGLKKAWDDFSEQVGSISKDMETIFGTAVRGMEDMFVEFLTKGKADFKGFVEEMGQTLLRLAFRRALFELGKSFIPGFGGTSTTAGAGLAGVAKPNALSSTGPVSGFSAPSGTTSKAGAGTIVVNITNNIDSRSDAAAIAQANERTRRQVVAEVSDLMRRGSPMFAR